MSREALFQDGDYILGFADNPYSIRWWDRSNMALARVCEASQICR